MKNYSLPASPAPSGAAGCEAPTAAQDEGGNAAEQEPAGNAGRHGKRGRRSHLHSSPSPVKRPPDAVAPGDYPYMSVGILPIFLLLISPGNPAMCCVLYMHACSVRGAAISCSTAVHLLAFHS